MSGPTLVRNPGEPVQGLADRGMEALMRLAVDRIGVCLEAISETRIREPLNDSALAECADSLGSLGEAIRAAAAAQLIQDLQDPPVPARFRARHLQVVRGSTR